MFSALKLLRLSSALKRRNSQEAYGAVAELGRIASDKAIDLLISCLDRSDGVARSAARELGRIGTERAIKPLAARLADSQVNQSAAEALQRFGVKAVDALIAALKNSSPDARRLAADVLAAIRDKRSIEPLIHVMQTDDEYAVRTAAARALGELKDSRALWVIVGTLKLRDESSPERQAALEQLRQAAGIAWRKIGDPLGKKAKLNEPISLEELEQTLPALEQADPQAHPKLAGDLSYVSESELIAILKEVVTASEEVSWAKLESREPMLASYLISYEQRRNIAEIVGTELRRRSGPAALPQLLERDLGNYTAIRNWWQASGLISS